MFIHVGFPFGFFLLLLFFGEWVSDMMVFVIAVILFVWGDRFGANRRQEIFEGCAEHQKKMGRRKEGKSNRLSGYRQALANLILS